MDKMDVINRLDFDLAVNRVKCDMRDDWYVDPLRYNDILKPAAIKSYFKAPVKFSKSEEFNIPKEGFVLREAREMLVYERVLYQALIDVLIEDIDKSLESCVYSHRLRPGKKNYLFNNTIDAWKAFVDDTRIKMEAMSDGILVVTDIQNYYQCLRIEQLCIVLRSEIESGDEFTHGVIELLRELLMEWEASGIGIPQNRDASSFLGNIYLKEVDTFMKCKYQYLRYMDDIRIICKDRFEARLALRDLVLKLRVLELSVNGAKTKFVSSSESSCKTYVASEDRRLAEIDELLKTKNVRSVRAAVPLLQNYTDELIKKRQTGTKAFRFCINRIERFARCSDVTFNVTRYINTAIKLLVEQPWSSEMLVRLIRSADRLTPRQKKQVGELVLCKARNIYDWQSYLLWQLAAILEMRNIDLMNHALESLKDELPDPYKAGAVLYIGKCGGSKERLQTVRLCRRSGSNLLLRSLAIATQEIGEHVERKAAIPAHYADSLAAISLDSAKMQYFCPLPIIQAKDIYDDLPNFYF